LFAIIGGISMWALEALFYESDDVDVHVAAAREIQAGYSGAELIIVPKSRAVIDTIPEDLVLDYSRGYAERLTHEFSTRPTGAVGASTSSAGAHPSNSMPSDS
jgi:hypothetical protein